MRLKRIIFVVISTLFISVFANGQELNCVLKINSDKVQGTNKSVFETLEKAANEFMNNRKWSDLVFEPDERIDCNINIIVNALDGNTFTSELIVQSKRPVFQSSYSTTLLNFSDKFFTFDYTEFEPLEFNPNSLSSNLVATLAYYAYIIIGYDMDSFSPLGGTPFFQQAENIVTQAQSSSWNGWKAFENNKNRYAVISSIMDETYKKFRNYFYQYHRLGLDVMSANVENGRTKIAEGIPIILEAYRAKTTTVFVTSFLDAKNDELINIFENGTSEEKKSVYETLTTINPSLTNRYDKILKH